MPSVSKRTYDCLSWKGRAVAGSGLGRGECDFVDPMAGLSLVAISFSRTTSSLILLALGWLLTRMVQNDYV